jgi:hypothetical protein
MLYPAAGTPLGGHAPGRKQVKGPLARADDFVIALRDADWHRSFSRDRVNVEL